MHVPQDSFEIFNFASKLDLILHSGCLSALLFIISNVVHDFNIERSCDILLNSDKILNLDELLSSLYISGLLNNRWLYLERSS